MSLKRSKDKKISNKNSFTHHSVTIYTVRDTETNKYYVGITDREVEDRLKDFSHPMKGRDVKIIKTATYHNLTPEEANDKQREEIKTLIKEGKKVVNKIKRPKKKV